MDACGWDWDFMGDWGEEALLASEEEHRCSDCDVGRRTSQSRGRIDCARVLKNIWKPHDKRTLEVEDASQAGT